MNVLIVGDIYWIYDDSCLPAEDSKTIMDGRRPQVTDLCRISPGAAEGETDRLSDPGHACY